MMGLDAESLLRTYGYWAVAFGTFFEGETILFAGVWAAQIGYLDVRGVAAAAVAGSFAGDQLYYVLGKSFGRTWLQRWPAAERSSRRVFALLDKHQSIFILAFRFLYGLRTIAPFVLGTSGVSARRFVPLNFAGAVLWSCTLAFGGMALADVGRRVWKALPGMHAKVIATSVVIPLLVALWILRRGRLGAGPRAT